MTAEIDVRRTQLDEPEDFRPVFEEFFPRLRSYFRASGFSAADAEDLSQSALWTVYRSRGQLRGDGSFEGWVYTVARNLARDEWRRRARHGGMAEPLSESAEAVADESPGIEERAASRQDLERTARALAKLPPRMRACLLLHVQQGLSYGDVARRLSLALPTVKVQIWTARRRLKELLR